MRSISNYYNRIYINMKRETLRTGILVNEAIHAVLLVFFLLITVTFYLAVNHDHDSVKQISTEWQKQPLIDIQIAEATQACPSHYEELFTREWPGTEYGCDCMGVYSTRLEFWQQNSMLNHGSCTYNQTRAGCKTVYPLDPVLLNNLGGFKICGLRGGSSFIQAQRPIDSKGQCPSGYEACNPTADFERRICSKNQTECPINDIKFVSSKRVLQAISTIQPAQNLTVSDWEYRTIRASSNQQSPLYLAFTKKAKSLGLMQYIMSSGQPCMDPSDFSVSNNYTPSYKYENPLGRGCKYDESTKQERDSRYRKAGYDVSEYDYLSYNGVMGKLASLSHYPQSEIEQKQRNQYSLFVRPTIYWSLQCELGEGQSTTVTRQEALQIFSNSGISMVIPITLVVLASVYGLLNISTICLNCLQSSRDPRHIFKTLSIRSVIMLLIGAISWFLFYRGLHLSQQELTNIQSLQTLNQCSDSDTQFTNGDIVLQLQRGVQLAGYGEIFAIIMAAIGLIESFAVARIKGSFEGYVTQVDELKH
ncbi:hypothetical protein FGO68_gene2934 [Halteria grandinella]|uniref:Uncharacterized protein n=1 Tax=Halteria grandinella TaxID=5974 RepID=A0A8J8NQK7_HALGN|nr:hypothetical protein FGO68_gene2934 [Halteria grandinella]